VCSCFNGSAEDARSVCCEHNRCNMAVISSAEAVGIICSRMHSQPCQYLIRHSTRLFQVLQSVKGGRRSIGRWGSPFFAALSDRHTSRQGLCRFWGPIRCGITTGNSRAMFHCCSLWPGIDPLISMRCPPLHGIMAPAVIWACCEAHERILPSAAAPDSPGTSLSCRNAREGQVLKCVGCRP
jgi:hypothetical protein